MQLLSLAAPLLTVLAIVGIPVGGMALAVRGVKAETDRRKS